jgi:hypothetical protein
MMAFDGDPSPVIYRHARPAGFGYQAVLNGHDRVGDNHLRQQVVNVTRRQLGHKVHGPTTGRHING